MVDRRPESTVQALTFKHVVDPQDPDVTAFTDLMRSTFADPNLILSNAQIERMLAESEQAAGRRLHLLLAKHDQQLVGGSLFSYVPATNCGFSEYIVLSPLYRGQGLARGIYEARRAALEADAQAFGRSGVYGLFVEVANPERVSESFKQAERRHGVDTDRRWRVMDHFGFRRLEMPYFPPPNGPGEPVVDYLDLLFRPLSAAAEQADSLPVSLVLETLAPVWRGWARTTYADSLARLADRIGSGPIALRPMVTSPPN